MITTMVLAGSANSDGNCETGTLNLGPYHWKKVYAVAKAKITLSDMNGIHRISDDQVLIPSRLTCRFSDNFCIDTKDGYVTWEHVNHESCSKDSYVVLYRGKASKIVIQPTVSIGQTYTLYSIKDGKFLATLTQKAQKDICGINIYTTNHPKLLVHQIRGRMSYFQQKGISASNMDIFLYVNAKFTHLEQHMRGELTSYEILVTQQCETRRDMLKTQLSLAVIDPVEFAYTYMKSPGYTGVVMGEQIHIIKCNPVFVSTRKTDECFNELPVNFTNKNMFMSPRSHIIQRTGTPVACSVLMQPAFQLAGTWFSSYNGLSKTSHPSVLSPSVPVIWVYTDAGSLASEGIYSNLDIDK